MIVTAGQMRQIENNALEYALSMERLMENAGSAAAAAIRRTVEVGGKYVTIFCGRGNNGGDGFVVARQLFTNGANVAVVLTDGEPATAQAKTMYEWLQNMDIPVVQYGSEMEYLTGRLAETDLLVDAVYGTGFHGALDARHRDICRLINGVDAPTVSLDIPSGVNADTGLADPDAVCADYTVMFDSLKPAGILPRAAKRCGELILADIGIPPEAHAGVEEQYTLVDEAFLCATLPKRARESHKGSYGKLLNVAGCRSYTGAAVLSSLAAMRSGAGYVILASTKEVCRTAQPSLLETVMLPLTQTVHGGISADALPELLETLKTADALLIGNGLGVSPDSVRILETLLTNASCPVVVDADGINLLAQNIDILKRTKAPVILTPHPGELARLTGVPVEQLKTDPLAAGVEFVRAHHVTLVLKDAYTLTVSAGGHVYVNTTGNAGLAKAGTGDVLAGVIGALAAQGRTPEHAAACGVYLHGLAGDRAAAVHSQYAMLARDVIDALGGAFLQFDR